MGFRLSLAGVAGLIVSIGFTADSFIVYFERIRDELRDGKSITGAVEDGWGRAKRTIYISKSINILAAVVLYILADATVKGFAFTLGLTTADRHPDLHHLHAPGDAAAGPHEVLRRGAPAVGPRPRRRSARSTAAVRSSARRSRTAAKAAEARDARSRGEAERRQTIAERKQAELQRRRHRQHRPDRQGGRRLMRSMSQFGNDLYIGQDLVPLRRATPAVVHHRRVLVIGSALVPLFRPIQFSIEFTGGSQFTVSGARAARPGRSRPKPCSRSCPTPPPR